MDAATKQNSHDFLIWLYAFQNDVGKKGYPNKARGALSVKWRAGLLSVSKCYVLFLSRKTSTT